MIRRESCTRFSCSAVSAICESEPVRIYGKAVDPQKRQRVDSVIRIYVMSLTGRKITLYIEANETVADVKALIQDKEGVTPEEQHLYLRFGRSDRISVTALKDYMRLSDYNIGHGEHLQLPLRLCGGIRIFVERLGQTMALNVEASKNVSQLRNTIYYKMTPMWRPEEQCLIFEGEQLTDGRRLTDYNIVHNSRIQCLFVPKAFDLAYVLHDGVCRRHDTIQTHRKDTDENRKATILDKEGIPSDQHCAWHLCMDSNWMFSGEGSGVVKVQW